MRRSSKPWPPAGSQTFVTEFLLFPLKATNQDTGQEETRWLERGTYLAEVVYWEHAFTRELKRWSLEPVQWVDTPQQRAEIERAKYDAYHLLTYRAWEAGDPALEEQAEQSRRHVPPFLQ